MKRVLFSLAFGMLLPCFAMAQTFEKLTFVLENGEVHEFLLREKPVITFDADMVTVATTTESITFNRNEVDSYSSDPKPESVIISTLPGLLVSRISNDLLRVDGAPAGCDISVWSVGGAACFTLRCNSGGSADVDLANLTPGVYVVRIGKCQTLKIVKQ